eukprot:8179487-Karenia_brevis.AAC.1
MDKCTACVLVTHAKSGDTLECINGAHRCAGVLKSSRACFLNHLGGECERAVCKEAVAAAKDTRPAIPSRLAWDPAIAGKGVASISDQEPKAAT